MPIRLPRTTVPDDPALASLAPESTPAPVQDIGQPVERVAGAARDTARMAAVLYERERDREVQARVLELDVQRRVADRQVLDTYLQSRGKAAVDGREAAMAAIERNSRAVRAKVKDKTVATLWARQDAALSNAALGQLDSHYRAQNVRWQADTLQARAEELVSSVGRVAFEMGYDPASGRLSVEAERTRSAFRDSIAELGSVLGWSKDQVEVEQRKGDSAALASVVQELVGDDRASEASKVLDLHAERIDPQVLRGLRSHVRRATVDEESFRLARAIAGTGKPLIDQLSMVDQRVGRETPIEVLGNQVGTAPAVSVEVADATRRRLREIDADTWRDRDRRGTEALRAAQEGASLARIKSYDALPLGTRESLEATGRDATFRLWLEQGGQMVTTSRGLRLLQQAEDPAWLRSRPLEQLVAAADADLSPADQRAIVSEWHKVHGQAPPSVDDAMVTRTLRRRMQEAGWLPVDREARADEANRYNWVLEGVHRELGPKAGPQERVDKVIEGALRETLRVNGAVRPVTWWTPGERKEGAFDTPVGQVARAQVSPELVAKAAAEAAEINRARRDWNAQAPVGRQVQLLPEDTPSIVARLAVEADSIKKAREAVSTQAMRWLQANRDVDAFERLPADLRDRLEKLDVLRSVRMDWEDWDRTHDFLGRRIVPEGPISRSPWGR